MHETDQPRPSRPVLDPVAFSLVITATLVSLALIGPLVRIGEVWVMIALSLVILGYRGWLLAHPGDRRVRMVGFWAGLVLSLVLIVISPIYGLYAFIGYLEGPILFKGGKRLGAMGATALIVALAQLGGPRSTIASWPIYGLFLLLNVLIAGIATLMERQRERTMTKLERTVAELRRAEHRNEVLREQLIAQAREAGVQDERARLAREIHDTVAQGLVGVITQLEAANPQSPDLDDRLARAADTARAALAETRRAVQALASPRLDSESLPEALAMLVNETTSPTLAARFVLDGEPRETTADAELLRVCQEGLSNVVRHAEASRVVVTLSYSPDQVRLDICDDGRGFDPDQPASGYGLAGMRERLSRIGGTVEIESVEGGGCAISAAISNG